VPAPLVLRLNSLQQTSGFFWQAGPIRILTSNSAPRGASRIFKARQHRKQTDSFRSVAGGVALLGAGLVRFRIAAAFTGPGVPVSTYARHDERCRRCSGVPKTSRPREWTVRFRDDGTQAVGRERRSEGYTLYRARIMRDAARYYRPQLWGSYATRMRDDGRSD
jgi:hypothetical protein